MTNDLWLSGPLSLVSVIFAAAFSKESRACMLHCACTCRASESSQGLALPGFVSCPVEGRDSSLFGNHICHLCVSHILKNRGIREGNILTAPAFFHMLTWPLWCDLETVAQDRVGWKGTLSTSTQDGSFAKQRCSWLCD